MAGVWFIGPGNNTAYKYITWRNNDGQLLRMHEKQLLDGKPRILSRQPNPNSTLTPTHILSGNIEDTMEWKSDSLVLWFGSTC